MEDVKVSENDPKTQTAMEIIKEIQVPRLIPLGEIVPGSTSKVISDPLFIFPDMENMSDKLLIEPEKVQTSSAVKSEKSPVASGSGLQRQPTTSGRSKRTLNRKLRLRTQDMIKEGIYYSGSEPESVEDNCLQLVVRDFMDLED